MTGDLKTNERVYVGAGAPVTGDEITANTNYGISTLYIDETNGAQYVRTGVNKVTGDWTQIGSSGSSLQSATVTLTDAQIKALPTTGIQIVAAPGADKIINIISAFAVLDCSAGVYTNIVDASWVLSAEPDSAVSYSSYFLAEQSLGDTNISLCKFAMPELIEGAATFAGSIITTQSLLSAYINKPVYIIDKFGGVTDYTGGNAANTLKVTVYYVVVDL